MLKQYIAVLDTYHPRYKDKFWFSGRIMKCTEEQAKPLLEKGKIRELTETDNAPKRYVDVIDQFGSTIHYTWSEYLKYRRSLKNA